MSDFPNLSRFPKPPSFAASVAGPPPPPSAFPVAPKGMSLDDLIKHYMDGYCKGTYGMSDALLQNLVRLVALKKTAPNARYSFGADGVPVRIQDGRGRTRKSRTRRQGRRPRNKRSTKRSYK